MGMAPPMKPRTPCRVCGKIPLRPHKKSCSVACWNVFRRSRPKRLRNCKRCGIEFAAPAATTVYCSKACFRKPATFSCPTCGCLFHPGHLKQRACSSKCRGALVAGPLSGRWKGGQPPNSRWTSKYRKWRSIIMERDGHKCTKCGSTERLEADHIRGWTKYPERRYWPSNGRILCRRCHHKRKNHGCWAKPHVAPPSRLLGAPIEKL